MFHKPLNVIIISTNDPKKADRDKPFTQYKLYCGHLPSEEQLWTLQHALCHNLTKANPL